MFSCFFAIFIFGRKPLCEILQVSSLPTTPVKPLRFAGDFHNVTRNISILPPSFKDPRSLRISSSGSDGRQFKSLLLLHFGDDALSYTVEDKINASHEAMKKIYKPIFKNLIVLTIPIVHAFLIE